MTEQKAVHHVTSRSWAFISLHSSAWSSVTDKAGHQRSHRGLFHFHSPVWWKEARHRQRSNLQAQEWTPSSAAWSPRTTAFLLLFSSVLPTEWFLFSYVILLGDLWKRTGRCLTDRVSFISQRAANRVLTLQIFFSSIVPPFLRRLKGDCCFWSREGLLELKLSRCLLCVL